jgi:predicted acyl esterase
MTNLNIKKRFPYKVKIIDNVWIPLSDGCKLAAKIFKPVSLSNKKIPAISNTFPIEKMIILLFKIMQFINILLDMDMYPLELI